MTVKAETQLISRRTIRTKKNEISLVFKWSGGPYIDVSEPGRTAMEVINVWNYERGEAEIAFTQKNLSAKVTEWINEYGKEELTHDVLENWKWSY